MDTGCEDEINRKDWDEREIQRVRVGIHRECDREEIVTVTEWKKERKMRMDRLGG